MPPSTPYERRFDGPGDPDSPSKKRIRKGATRLSCAECRRLKLRCDRAIPCSSCVKRGCSAICPDGSLTTGQGNRFVLASTQELHEKISELANRVRELEDALRSSHSQLSAEQHPLLSEELLRIKAPLQREAPAPRNESAAIKEEESNPDVVDAFGSLSISLSGRTKYYGHIANSWYFLQNETQEDEDEHDDILINLQNFLPPDILKRAAAFPISSASYHDNVGLQTLCWHLPSADIAAELQTIYYRHAAWMYNPVSQESFTTDIFAQFYSDQPNSELTSTDPALAHKLSLMFMVLAVGTLMNPSLPAYNIEAEKYHQLARAALFHHTLFEEPTITAVQALYLMTYYLFLADRHGTSSGARWAIMGISVKVAQSIGLHRDSGRWRVDPIETQRRRELFWELFTYDSWQCLTFGRPPSFALPHIDCKLPFATDTSDELAFHAWKHRFTSECMNLFQDQAFGAKLPTYATVLQLDRKMRAFPVPPVLQVAGFGSSEPRAGGYPETMTLTLQRHIVLAIREMNLLYLHRSFFARAISDHPKDPLGSPYGTSVIAAYRSAGSLVALMRNLYTQLKEPSERMWFLWTHMFSCAIILGSIVTRCPSMSLSPSALVQLDSACELFSKAARGFRATRVLNIMLNLQQRAHLSLDEFRAGKGSPTTRYSFSSEPTSPEDADDELSILGGKTRLVEKKSPSSPQSSGKSPLMMNNPIVPLPLSPGMQEQVDPNVLEYLRSFGQPTSHIGYQQEPLPSMSNQGSFANEYQTSSIYGMPTIPNPSFVNEPVAYVSQSSMQEQPQMHSQQNRHGSSSSQHSQGSLGMMEGPAIVSSLPQYFPVYDYNSGGNIVNGNGFPSMSSNAMLQDSNTVGRRNSGSPDGGNMHSTWQDFVDTFSV